MTTENFRKIIMEQKEDARRAESLLRRMERMMGGAVKEKSRQRQAQELVYDAWEAADSDKAFDLLQAAIDLDSDNADAWLGLMDFMGVEGGERIEMLRKLVTMGEKSLGKKVFKKDKGYFWGLLETRPYMRVRSQLALRLMEAGQYEESIAEHEAMLKLNPNDNQGVRYGLMALYLALKWLDGAKRLFRKYNERKFSTVWAWGYVLEQYLSGDMDGAAKALLAARKQNPHAQAYFLAHRKLPKNMPGSYSPGSQEEAVIAWEILRIAWQKHPDAQSWLKSKK